MKEKIRNYPDLYQHKIDLIVSMENHKVRDVTLIEPKIADQPHKVRAAREGKKQKPQIISTRPAQELLAQYTVDAFGRARKNTPLCTDCKAAQELQAFHGCDSDNKYCLKCYKRVIKEKVDANSVSVSQYAVKTTCPSCYHASGNALNIMRCSEDKGG